MRNKKLLITFLLFIFALSLSACNKQSAPKQTASDGYYSTASNGMSSYMVAYDYEEAAYDDAVYSSSKSISSDAAVNTASQQRMIRKNASLTITVEDALSVMNEIVAMAEDMGGWVVSSSSSREYYRDDIYLPYADLTIRIPSERLTDTLDRIEAFTTDREKYVTNRKVTGVDITSDYVDTQSRLTASEKTLDKLYEILDTAENAEEALYVYREISDIESDVEVLKGQIKYMEESVAMSSITLRINTIRPAVFVVASKWSIGDAIHDAFESLVDLSKGLIEFLINFVIVFIPGLIVIAIPIYGIYRLVKFIVKKIKDKKTAKLSQKEKKEKNHE